MKKILCWKGRVLSRGVTVALLLSMIVLLFQAFPAMSADDDLYVANWLKEPTTSVLHVGPQDSWDESGVGSASIWIVAADDYRMWYTGYNGTGLFQIGYATSTDGGVTWDKYDKVIADDGGPVLTPGGTEAWDEKGVGSPCVFRVAADDYRMWYTGYKEVDGELIPQIGYATSTNGQDWDKYDKVIADDGGPVLFPGGSGAWDENGVHSAAVISDNTTFKMWYTGRSGGAVIGTSKIGYATSTDGGESWTKYSGTEPGGPVLSPGASGAWDERGVAVANVIPNGGKYYMWYSGYSGFGYDGVQVSIGVAKSDNGITPWTKNTKPVLTKEASGWNSGGVGAPCVIEASDTKLLMWYSGVDSELTASEVGAALVERTELTGTITLEGGYRPPDKYQVPLTLKLYDTTVPLDYTNIFSEVPIYTFTTADGDITFGEPNTTARTIDFSANVSSGDYKITLHTPHALINLKEVTLTAPTQSVNMGTLLEGNANEDIIVSGLDFDNLLTDYLQTEVGPKWNEGRCDFDRNGQVTSIDFSLLADNYNKASPQTVG